MALNNVPLSPQTLSFTQPLIQSNFQWINDGFAVDHQSFNSVGAGWHLKLSLPAQATAAIPALPGTGATIYYAAPDKSENIPGVAEYPVTTTTNCINVRRSNSTKVIPINYGNITLDVNTGFSFLPSGVLLKWGRVSALPATDTGFIFPVGDDIPAFTTIFNMLITPIMIGGQAFSTTAFSFTPPFVSAMVTTGFQITAPGTTDSNPFDLSYLAIGLVD